MSLLRRNPKRDGNEKHVITAFHDMGCTCFRLSEPGLPDLLVFGPKFANQDSRAFLVEVKSSVKETLTPEQDKFHKRAWECEWPVYVVHSPDDAMGVLNRVVKR